MLYFIDFGQWCKTYKSVIKRPIKIRTNHVVGNNTHRLTNLRQALRADGQVDKHSGGQTGRFEPIRYPRIQLLSLSENGKAKESTYLYGLFTKMI